MVINQHFQHWSEKVVDVAGAVELAAVDMAFYPAPTSGPAEPADGRGEIASLNGRDRLSLSLRLRVDSSRRAGLPAIESLCRLYSASSKS